LGAFMECRAGAHGCISANVVGVEEASKRAFLPGHCQETRLLTTNRFDP